MKKGKIFILSCLLFSGMVMSSCSGLEGPIGPQGNIGNSGETGDPGKDGVSVVKIEKTSSNGLVDTYTITYSDGTTSVFTVTNGADGSQGVQGLPGADGHTPVITIGANGNWFVDGVDTGVKAQGQQGNPGKDGVSVVSITKTGSEGLVDTYTITYSDGSFDTFTITNGEQGSQGIQGLPGSDGSVPEISIGSNGNWYINGTDTGFSAKGPKGSDGANGVSIVSISKTSSNGLVDTYTITYSNGATATFTVTNGATGGQGIEGQAGSDGHTPSVVIGENGNWFVDGVDTNIPAQGPKGEDGVDGVSVVSITKTDSEGLVDTYTITYSNGNTDTFTVTNGSQGIQGIQGQQGASGDTPVITIKDGFWYINGENTNVPCFVGENASPLYNKTVSILGDSISTFAGYIPEADGTNLEHRARYPQDNLLTDVNLTWWKRLINDYGAELGINESWAGSRVSNSQSSNTTDFGPDACMASMTRINNLGANGIPDIIFFYGGTNDIGGGVNVGNFDTTKNYTVNTSTTTWSSFADSYKDAVMRIQYLYPNTKLVCMLPTYTADYYTVGALNTYNAQIIKICDYFGVDYVDLRQCGITPSNQSVYLPDGIHPNAEGMKLIENKMMSYLNDVTLEDFSKDMYTVTHDLTNVKSSASNLAKVAKHASFTAKLTANKGYEIDNVEVIYGTEDITTTAYANGTVTISDVTKNIKITATAVKTSGGDEPEEPGDVPTSSNEHVQTLPADTTNETNLWDVLNHDAGYYGTDGSWGTNGAVGSITFPVLPGHEIYASSFPGKGIRVTFLNDNQIVKSYSPDEVLAAYNADGYVVVPDGANCANIPVWDINAKDNVVKILNYVAQETVGVTLELDHVNSSFSGTIVVKNSTFTTTLTAQRGYILDSISVIYNGEDVTDTKCVNNVVTIENIEYDVRIIASSIVDEEAVPLPETANTHAHNLPETISNATNLWNVIEHDSQYYNGSIWTASGAIASITFPVEPGYRIYASSLEASPANGGTRNGIRFTMFNDNTVVNTYDPSQAYDLFKTNKYIEIPNGVNCVNIPVWDSSRSDIVIKIINVAEIEYVDLIQNLTNVSSSTDSTKLIKGESFTCFLIGEEGYKVDSIQVLMGETDITETVVNSRTISIDVVTDDITIIATGVEGQEEIILPTTTNSHASALPLTINNDTNLWDVLTHSDEYYLGSAWGTNPTVANCGSITFPVKPGYKIYSSSFESSATNNGTSNGIRVTFFNGESVVRSYSPTDIYGLASANNGYIVIPDGVDCINVPMWNKNATNNVCKILNVIQ